jgi:chromosomal replication initiation ATPase DnaA
MTVKELIDMYANIIINAALQVCKLDRTDILSNNKKQHLNEARQLIMFVMHTKGFEGKEIAAYLQRSKAAVSRSKRKVGYEAKIYATTKQKLKETLAIVEQKERIIKSINTIK